MKILVVYYSRTNITRKVADSIANKIDVDIEEIIDTKNRDGVRGYITAGRDAMQGRLTKLEPCKSDVAKYDMVCVGTPIWGWNVSTPIRTFLEENKDRFKDVSFFCTMGGSGDDKAFKNMVEILGKNPKATLSLLTKDVVKNNVEEKINKYLSEVKEK